MKDVFHEIMDIVNQAEHLGSRKLSNGVHLIGNVPHVAPEAYLHVIYPALDNRQIASIENDIGRALPSALKEFYKHSNGIKLFAYTLSLSGLRHSYVRTGDEAWQPFSIVTPNVHERPANTPESLVFFGFYRWDGSRLGMSPDSPKIYRFARYTANPINEWSSFDDMLVSEVHRLSALFDESGRKFDEDAATTP